MKTNASYESKLYSNLFHGFALQRSGAVRFLQHQKCWSPDGELVQSNSPSAVVPAYTLQELMVKPFTGQIEFVVTGNLEIDLAHAVHQIVATSMNGAKMPFRCWSYDRYLPNELGRSDQMVVVGGNGRPILVNVQGNSFGKFAMIVSDDEYKLRSIEIEQFTGFMDKNFVPVMENDVVIFEKLLYVVKSGISESSGWELRPFSNNESGKTYSLLEETKDRSTVVKSSVVLGSSRMDLTLISAIADLV